MSDFREKDKKKNAGDSQRLAGVPTAETKLVLLQLLVYLIWPKDGVSG